ncbi:hypothetical protein OAR38_00395 [Flavobacteriaceae bacterium]|jgi:hypothetical protein|nr:hypothetical protein [Flavobacteriaceae bacterium]MDB4050722.1 hypothetical protein [Flavobacteriaceae bacterium]MDB4087121.1 hypothetical protein [Flavobacteriaceae bacterium]MDB4239382.1 hypothetical protein [Flavobacteriaceae bacterium]MDB9787571.1 hypothetical protein [Flavobacteriaceae bacterium]
MITLNNIENVQKEWGDSLVKLGSLKSNKEACNNEAESLINRLYGYNNGTVLFKPTKAKDNQFRLTFEGAKSYFIGENSNFSEDKGFALQPWTNVRFENASVVLKKDSAIAMGNYFFTENNGNEVKVEYTFGYFLSEKKILKINLHHSSLPYIS